MLSAYVYVLYVMCMYVCSFVELFRLFIIHRCSVCIYLIDYIHCLMYIREDFSADRPDSLALIVVQVGHALALGSGCSSEPLRISVFLREIVITTSGNKNKGQ